MYLIQGVINWCEPLPVSICYWDLVKQKGIETIEIMHSIILSSIYDVD